MNEKAGIVIPIAMMFFIMAFTLGLNKPQLVYSVASLEELENRVNETVAYRAELLDYVKSHNMTLTSDPLLIDTPNLEQIVKQHMEDCKSGAREAQNKLVQEQFGFNLSELGDTC